MTVDSTHPDYNANPPAWSRARDVLAGEDAVKPAGEKYLPRLDSQNDEEYAAYRVRASFFGATARTLKEYLDLLFRPSSRRPVVEFQFSTFSFLLSSAPRSSKSFFRKSCDPLPSFGNPLRLLLRDPSASTISEKNQC